MKTKVRIIRGRIGNYDSLTMEVLAPKFERSSLFDEPIGTITWQGDSKYEWYAMKFNVEAELQKHKNLFTMYKLACYVKERVTNDSPIETMGIIGGEEHFYTMGQYISIADNGKQVYDVIADGKHWCRIVAPNEVVGSRIVDGMVERKELRGKSFLINPYGERLQFTPTNLAWKK